MASHQRCHGVSDIRLSIISSLKCTRDCMTILIHCGGQTDCPIYVGNVNSALIRQIKIAHADIVRHIVLIAFVPYCTY
jgi:hypothetical protein